MREEKVVPSPDHGPLVHTVYSVRSTSHFQKNETGACLIYPSQLALHIVSLLGKLAP